MFKKILGKDIAGYISPHKRLIMLAIILTALSSFLIIIPVYLLQPFVDKGMKMASDPVEWAIPWITFESLFSFKKTQLVLVSQISPNKLLLILTAIAFISVILKSVTMYLGQLSAVAFSNRSIRELRVDLAGKFISLPLSFYHKRKIGELIARATADLTVLQTNIGNVIIGLIRQPLMTIVFLIYLFFMNWRLTLLTIIVAPIIVSLVRIFGRKIKKHSARVQDATAEVTSSYQEILLLLKVIKGFCMGHYESRKFRFLAENLYKKIMHWNRYKLGIGPMMDSTLFLMLPLILIAGKVYFDHTLGEMVAMLYAYAAAYKPIKELARINNNVKTLQGATTRLFDIMRTVPSIQDKPMARPLPGFKDAIEFSHVSFGYKPNKMVLTDICLKVHSGETVAFVGPTGAGKSTLLDLLPRFYDVNEGAIRIDGTDIRDVTVESLRDQIGIVAQESLLFHDTIANNINYNKGNHTREEIEKAAKVAQAHDFIITLPDGYETIVGDRGALLSGGQRQRIAIARAILKDPAIIILDEPASALDPESEMLIQQALENFFNKKTILIISHRLNTIKKSHKIYVIDNGRIVESGTHDELLTASGKYKSLYNMQFRA